MPWPAVGIPFLDGLVIGANGRICTGRRRRRDILFNATAGTAITFFALSAAITSGRDFTFMRGFLMTGLIVCLLAIVAGFFFQVPGLQLAISGALILLAAGFILFDTSNIVRGGETNYVMATVSLYINIYMLFSNLLAIMGVMGSDD